MEPFQINPSHARIVLPADAPHHEWLEERYNGIGGSEIAAVAGINPYQTPYQLWLVKTRRIDPELFHTDEERERFRWGHKLEPVIVDAFAEDHPHLHVTRGHGTYARPDAKHHRVNVDGIAWTSDGQLDGVVEAKTGNHRQRRYWENGEAPVQYVAQCQWAMHVTGAPRAYLVALVDNEWHQRDIERDDELISDLAAIADEFWSLVETDTPPPVDSSDTTRRMLSATHTEEGGVVALDDEWESDLNRHKMLSDQIKTLTEQRDEIANRLRAAMGEAEIAELFGQVVATFKRPKPQHRVCAKTLKNFHPDVYEKVARPTESSRRLVFK